MDKVNDNELENQTSSEEMERSYAPTNSGQPNQMPNVNEEMGADFAYGIPTSPARQTALKRDAEVEKKRMESSGAALGWISLVFAVASWILWPVLLGLTSAVLGYMAYRQGAKGLGGWAITIGLIAVALNLVIVPFYYALS